MQVVLVDVWLVQWNTCCKWWCGQRRFGVTGVSGVGGGIAGVGDVISIDLIIINGGVNE